MKRVIISYGVTKDGKAVPLYTGDDADKATDAIFLAGYAGQIEKGYLVKNPGWDRRFADFRAQKGSPEGAGEGVDAGAGSAENESPGEPGEGGGPGSAENESPGEPGEGAGASRGGKTQGEEPGSEPGAGPESDPQGEPGAQAERKVSSSQSGADDDEDHFGVQGGKKPLGKKGKSKSSGSSSK